MKTLIGKFLLVYLAFFGLLEGEGVAQTVIRVGYSGGEITRTQHRVYAKANVWDKRGLDVRPIYFTSGSIMAQAMLTGEILLADSDVPGMLMLGVSGVMDVKVIAVTINRIPQIFAARNNIQKPQDLRGKRVGISRFGSASDITTRLLLRFWQIDPEKDVQLIQSGNGPIRIAAMAAGHLDAGILGLESEQQVLALGCCKVFANLLDLPMDYARFGIVAPVSALKTRRDVLQRFLEGLVEGIHAFKTRPDLALAVLGETIRDPKVAKTSYQSWGDSLRDYPVPEPVGMQAALDSLIGITPKARGASAKDFTDVSLLEQIKRSGYIDRLYNR
jgi:ABC-type nitrate/sulfonate/bicarbonate transport system substrate-binding protein